MSVRNFYFFLCCFLFYNAWSQSHFPGGVAGAEVWYVVDYNSFNMDLYPNQAGNYITIEPTQENDLSTSLFNFNHSLKGKVSLGYQAPLEINTSRNIFFVGDVESDQYNYSHVTTEWMPYLSSIALTDSIIKNRFDLSLKSAYINKKSALFQSTTTANVNFYHWNMYDRDKRFKSYGEKGETQFYIGKNFVNPAAQGDLFFGNFPEFISFPFELTFNQKNRVESYLALKYGISLALNTPYRNSRNIVFWNALNYTKFSNRIFGMGRDDVSGLNQLQSESVHKKDYLIASIEKLAPTNPIKQQEVSINNDHFLVFADNGAIDGFGDLNSHGVAPSKKKWLSQSTGKSTSDYPINFKLSLNNNFGQSLANNPTMKLWMLHDRFVNNQTVSDFSSQYVEYYQPVGIDQNYASFENVFFDTDKGVFDQFTFAIGPEIIVQARTECTDLKTYIVITGGKAPFHIDITSSGNDSSNIVTPSSTEAFQAAANNTYVIHVTDATGSSAETTTTIVSQQINVNLGPDIVLTASLQQVLLNAGQNVQDPLATYQWYRDGDLLENFTSTLLVTEPGEYEVIVTNGNRMCSQSDTVRVGYNFLGTVVESTICADTMASVTLNLSGGVPPFTTVVSGNIQTVSQVHNLVNYTISGIEFGPCIVTTIDSQGSIFQTNITLNDPQAGILTDLATQLGQLCASSSYGGGTVPGFSCDSNITLDAGHLVTAPLVSYQWYKDWEPLPITGPLVELYHDNTIPANPNPDGFNEFIVEVMDLNTGCSRLETVAVSKSYSIQEVAGGQVVQRATDAVNGDSETQTGDKIVARVYPNPSNAGSVFYYELSYSQVFEGTVEIYSPTGALLQSTPVNGNSTYKIPFTLLTSGTYFIRTQTSQTTLTNKVIIK
jgi:hypothetical protein